MSGASERASGLAAGRVLTSRFIDILNHGAAVTFPWAEDKDANHGNNGSRETDKSFPLVPLVPLVATRL